MILLTIDSLRADHSGCCGCPEDVSPNIDNLAKKGALFLEAMSNGTHTASSFPPILTSSYASFHDIAEKTSGIILRPEYRTVAEELQNRGYSTATFHANPYISRFFNYNKGFDVFEDFIEKRDKKHYLPKDFNIFHRILEYFRLMNAFFNRLLWNGREKRANAINQKAISWLENITHPFFLWLHYMDVHVPYMSPNCTLFERMIALNLYRKRHKHLSDQELERLIKLYDDEIRYVDSEIGFFLNDLEKIGVSLDNTYVIVTSDHGEKFNEHQETVHGGKPYNEVIRVPLIIAGPGIEEDMVIKDQVCLLDLSPTILDLLNIERIESFLGTSLLPLMRGKKMAKRYIISEDARGTLSCTTQKWKLIRDAGGECEFYDLEKDPQERVNLIDSKNGKIRELIVIFSACISEHIQTGTEAKKAMIAAREKEHIKKRLKLLRSRIQNARRGINRNQNNNKKQK